MHSFSRQAPRELTAHPDPGIDDRTGPPLTRGSLFTLLATVAGDDLSPASLSALRGLDTEAWYHGQLLESFLDELEEKDPELLELAGRNINFMFRAHLEELGLRTAAELVVGLPSMWQFATRGDSGVWRTVMTGPSAARVEGEQPYNCLFEAGGLRGFIEALDGRDVKLDHSTCRRRGDAFCTFDIRWQT